MIKKIKNFVRWILDLDPWPINYGLLSALGLMIVSLILEDLVLLVLNFEKTTLSNLIIYIILSIAFYIPIRKLIEFRIGYLIGFILAMGIYYVI